MKPKKWPITWKHKKTKKKFRVMPWWECIDPILSDEDVGKQEERKFKIGSLVQIGWLLENEHGIWIGLGPKAEKEFEEVSKK